MRRFFTVLPALALVTLPLVAAPAAAAPVSWAVDKGHSEVGFKVKHLVISKGPSRSMTTTPRTTASRPGSTSTRSTPATTSATAI